MKRREFITLLGGAAAWPLAARAQQSERIRRVNVLLTTTGGEGQARDAAFRAGLERRGWLDGRNVQISTRFIDPADGLETTQLIAKEFVALRPDVILVQSTPHTAAMQRQTRSIPIVFVGVSDPVGAGFAESLRRPGGNLTGLVLFESSVTGKWIGMLKEIAPRLQRVALLYNPNVTTYWLRTAQSVAPSLAIELVPGPVENAKDIERNIELFARAPDGALIVPPDFTLTNNRGLIIALAARHRMPAIYSERAWMTDGGLMYYGTDRIDQFRQAADYVDRILRGDQPADLPVQAPTKYETIVNARTAKALGLVVPPSLLVAADEVIE
jgi:putative tryptophan/tyrosine transport system substrate-binding protein